MKRCILLFGLHIFISLSAPAQETQKPPASHNGVYIYAAGFEKAKADFEEQLFYNITTTRFLLQPGLPVSPTAANMYGCRLSAKTPFGPALLLKVDSADVFDLSVQAMFYKTKIMETMPVAELQKLAPLLVQSAAGSAGTGKGTLLRQSKELLLYPGSGILQPADDKQADRRGACLNWILLDSALKPVADKTAYGFLKAGKTDKLNLLSKSGITITHPGYFLVYLSNETPLSLAIFDNLVVKHNKTANRSLSGFIITEDNFSITTENNINLITEN
jgi:hypothetical protein